MRQHRVTRARGAQVAAAFVLAAVAPLVPASRAAAGTCAGSGVTVVVDYNELGGRTKVVCAAEAGGATAARAFVDAGYRLEYQPQLQDFVCRLSGRPTDRPCTDASSYWSLWWADGPSGEWTYSTLGVTSLKVPQGGYVGFAWHEGDDEVRPPDVRLGGGRPADATTGAAAQSAQDSGDPSGGDSHSTWAALALAAVVLAAAVLVPVLRRRS